MNIIVIHPCRIHLQHGCMIVNPDSFLGEYTHCPCGCDCVCAFTSPLPPYSHNGAQAY